MDESGSSILLIKEHPTYDWINGEKGLDMLLVAVVVVFSLMVFIQSTLS